MTVQEAIRIVREAGAYAAGKGSFGGDFGEIAVAVKVLANSLNEPVFVVCTSKDGGWIFESDAAKNAERLIKKHEDDLAKKAAAKDSRDDLRANVDDSRALPIKPRMMYTREGSVLRELPKSKIPDDPDACD